MKRYKTLVVGLSLSAMLSTVLVAPQAHALGKNTGSGSGTQVSSSMETFLLNLGIYYAKTNPQVAPFLTALNINSAADLKRLLNGDLNGSNFQDIITNAALQYAFSNPKYADLFAQLGVTDFASLKELLNGGDGASTEMILNLAFTYMQSNPQYGGWLSQLGIEDASDLSALLNGNGEGTDLTAVVLNFAMIYAQKNPKYGMYIMLISALLGGDSGVMTGSLEDPFLGAFEGLSSGEILRIQKAKKLKL